MSTKTSLGYCEVVTKSSIHIYLELLDGEYYLETEGDKIKLPNKDIAEKMARAIDGN